MALRFSRWRHHGSIQNAFRKVDKADRNAPGCSGHDLSPPTQVFHVCSYSFRSKFLSDRLLPQPSDHHAKDKSELPIPNTVGRRAGPEWLSDRPGRCICAILSWCMRRRLIVARLRVLWLSPHSTRRFLSSWHAMMASTLLLRKRFALGSAQSKTRLCKAHLVHQVSDWGSGVAIKMGRRQGATKEHI
jgi:hypothetical protein